MGDEVLTINRETLENMFKGVEERLEPIKTLDARLEEIGGKLVATVDPEDKGDKDDEGKDAELHKGALAGITEFKVWDIPVGQALVGGFVAVFTSELVDSFLVAQSGYVKGIIKLAGAGVAVKWGSRLLGDTGSKAVALLLAYDGIRSLIPIDEWAGRASGIIRARTGAGLAGKAGMENYDVQKAANKVVSDYYSNALGG